MSYQHHATTTNNNQQPTTNNTVRYDTHLPCSMHIVVVGLCDQPYYTYIKLLRYLLQTLEVPDITVSRIEGLILTDDQMEILKQTYAACPLLATTHSG
jgi:hypothetical protein